LNSRFLPLIMLLALPLAGAEPLIRTADLKAPTARFTLTRDIFMGIGLGPQPAATPALPPPRPGSGPVPQLPQPGGQDEMSVSEEIYRSIGYMGHISRYNRSVAMLNISGDFQLAGEGEMVLERFKVTAIRPDSVTIEYEGQKYEIRLAGDNNG
jgi:hypothetical protein